MKCPICKGDGTSNICINGTFLPCSYCDGKGTVEELTNAEWLRQASDEELAEVVYSLVWLGNELFDRLECSGEDSKENDLKIVTEWLQEKHN